jgi:glycosyltransferase involved in cell wall biosynthesis
MRIVIDMQGAQNGSRFRGIGRYTTAFAKGLIKAAKNDEIILTLNGAFAETVEPIRTEFNNLFPSIIILVWQPIAPVHFLDSANYGRRLASEAMREVFLSSLKPDVVIISSMFEGAGDNVVSSISSFPNSLPTTAILYDFIPLIYSKEYLADINVNKWYMEKLNHLKKADLLLSISESSKEEGIKYLGLPEDVIVNISTAIESNFKESPGSNITDLKVKFDLNQPYLMYSGASDPRKNLIRLLEAYAALPPTLRSRHQLLLAGGMPQDHIDALKKKMSAINLLEHEVRFTGHITDNEMIGLYRGALGYVFPSYHEGFGLPILEAMAFDIPVIGSNISSIPEVINNPDALFDPFSVASMTDAIARLLTDTTFRKALVDNARKQRELFSWEATANRALNAIKTKFNTQNQGMNLFGDLPKSQQQDLVTSQISMLLAKGDFTDDDLSRAAKLIDFALPRRDKLHHLFVDISELQRTNGKTGIQRVVSKILSGLFKQVPNDFQVIPVYATRTDEYRVANSFMCKLFGYKASLEVDHPLDIRIGDIFLGLDYQDQLIYDRRHYYHQLQLQGVIVYFVVYDILPQLLEGVFIDAVTHNQSSWLKTVARFDGLICISKAVATELKNWLEIFGPPRSEPLKIGWFHLGADFASQKPIEKPCIPQRDVLAKIQSQQSFLVVSTLEPRKRQTQVLDAFELLWNEREDVCLVLVGKQGWMVDDLIVRINTHPEKNRRLFWLEGIEDELLDEVYAASSCLIAPSSGEGFGLSLIEAAQHNIPILARNIPVFKEVAGRNATYFTGMEGSDLAQAVLNWRKQHRSGNTPKSGDIPLLTWQQSTKQVLDVVFHSNWYSQWVPSGRLSYTGSDNELGTQIGRRTRFEMRSTGKAGYLLFGPYISLKAGTYKINLFGTVGQLANTHAHMDVVSVENPKVHGSTILSRENGNNRIATLDVSLNTDVSKAEVRVWVSDDALVSIEMLQITPHINEAYKYEHTSN